MKLRRSMLSASIAAALFLTGTVAATAAAPAPQPQAQSQATPDQAAAPSQAPDHAPHELATITVVGVRASQMNDIQRKRSAGNIEDSITAENIGQLPDFTISDSLQRVTGVQIGRSAGEGTTVAIRGLPEVATLLNGEAFISADNIDSIQPNYEAMPASLFEGADVYKSPRGDILNSGISGTINLRTRRPWDMKSGWTVAGSAAGVRSDVVKKTRPDANAFFSYNGGRWGALLGLSYSNTYANNSSNGLAQFEGRIAGENPSSAQASDGYIGSYTGLIPVPSDIKQFANGSADVNGDGKADGAFYTPDTLNPFQQTVQRKRLGLNASTQFDFGNGLSLTADGFFTRQNQMNYGEGAELMPVGWLNATQLPVKSRDTGYVLHNAGNGDYQDGDWNQHFFTTQSYKKYLGDWLSYSQGVRTHSLARNYNVALDYDNGGKFTGTLRWVNGTASQSERDTYVEFSQSNGTQWPNALLPGAASSPDFAALQANTAYVFPDGNRVFNPTGFPAYSEYAVDDFSTGTPHMTISSGLAKNLANPDSYHFKTLTANQGAYDQSTSMNIVRFDGHYAFTDEAKLNFGFRNSVRSARADYFNTGEDAFGCHALYMAADVILNADNGCVAGNDIGYYRAAPSAGLTPSQLPDVIANNWREVTNPGNVQGLTEYALDASAMKNPDKFTNAVYPGMQRYMNPATTWDVLLHERTAYGELDFKGTVAGFPFSGNFGLRVVRTKLGVSQHLGGDAVPGAVLLPPADGGIVRTNRKYTDWLPAINVAINLTDKAVLRMAGSKNMMPLTLSQWGGGLQLNYAIQPLAGGGNVFAIQQSSQGGNPNLDPWRSTNYDISFEYYFNDASMASIDLFDIQVSKFITSGNEQRCDLADKDGVVRRCVLVTGPQQGAGTTLKGIEADYRQAFTFLPGFLRNTGMEINGTYAPSDMGTDDMSGAKVPFADNSKYSGNLILWYQDEHLQARAAANYRSKTAIGGNYGGIIGFQEYQEPTTYIDASVSYNINKNLQVFLQGRNLTNEKQRYYVVWADQIIQNRYSDRTYMAGIRANF